MGLLGPTTVEPIAGVRAKREKEVGLVRKEEIVSWHILMPLRSTSSLHLTASKLPVLPSLPITISHH